MGFIGVGVIVNAALLAATRNQSPQPYSIAGKRDGSSLTAPLFEDMCPPEGVPSQTLPEPSDNCTLNCGPCGSCVIGGRDSPTPLCFCVESFATFPEDCLKGTKQCVVQDGQTVCSCQRESEDDGTLSYFYACGYQRRSTVASFLASFLGGTVGADWFYLYRGGKGGYIAAGIFKLLTCGGFLIWSTVDWIRIAASTTSFLDGNGFALSPWSAGV